jgi:DNA invertase Pin-like site-specific DNA recombinase
MEAVIYTRVSLDRNGGRSVEDQERECRAECERRGWPVRAVYTDNGISASRYGRHRPEWEKCKASLRAKDVLVVWEASRAQRDLEEFVRLRNICAELSVLLSYSGKVLDFTNGQDRFTGGLDALLAERESEYLKERVIRGKEAGAREGRPAGRVPWGYVLTRPGVWEPHPTEAPKIREAVARILRGDSHYSVWQWVLAQDGYKPPSLTVMNRSLRNPTLAGLRTHRRNVIGKGNWEPLITETEHRQLLVKHGRLRATHRFVHQPGPEPQHLLSGIARCGTCREGMAWRKNRQGKGIYACRHGHATRLAHNVDSIVEERLFGILSEVDPRQFEADDPQASAVWQEIEALENRRAEWQELALSGEITPQSFATFEKSLDKQIKDLEAKAVPDALAEVDVTTIRANWSDMPMVERRRIIRAFFTVTVVPSTQGGRVGTGGVEVVPL